MMMRSDFCALILTHQRADRVYTYNTLRKQGYTGPIVLVVDDQDPQLSEYIDRYGDQVEVFSKDAMRDTFDVGDNADHTKGVIYARNASPQIAKKRGFQYYIELDDDYKEFVHRIVSDLSYKRTRSRRLDDVFEIMLDFLISTPTHTLAMAQAGGDWAGGSKPVALKRKCMNTFICDVDDPVTFLGRINEDTTTYMTRSRQGVLYFTFVPFMITQVDTQTNAGGMTILYLDHGTYVKSFYSVMYAPSCVKIGVIKDPRPGGHPRFHHDLNWNAAAPKILRESVRKVTKDEQV